MKRRAAAHGGCAGQRGWRGPAPDQQIRRTGGRAAFLQRGQGFQICLRGAVAQKHGLGGVERRGKFFWTRNESDEAPASRRKEAGDIDLRVLTGGVLNFQDAIAHGAARGGKCRGQQDSARSEGAMCGQNFSGKRATGRGVNLLEQKCLGIGGNGCGSARHDVRCPGRRERARVRIEDLHRLRGRNRRCGAKPDAHRAVRAKKCRGRVAGAGEIVGQKNDVLRKRSPGWTRFVRRILSGSRHSGGDALFSRVYDYFLIFGMPILEGVFRAGTRCEGWREYAAF